MPPTLSTDRRPGPHPSQGPPVRTRGRRRLLSSSAAVVLGATALGAFPVVTPAWAQPHPVAPGVHTRDLSGVDASAMAAAPAAFDPAEARALEARAAASAARPSSGAVLAQAPDDVPDPTTRVARTARPAVFTPTLSTGRFTAAGVQWEPQAAPAGIVVQVRLHENGTWSDWQVLDQEGGPDAGTGEARRAAGHVATSPIVSPDADGVQVRVDTTSGRVPRGLRLLTIDPGTSAADASLTGAPAASASAATTQPGIYSRAQWGADESLLAVNGPCPGYMPTLKVGFVHHTVSTNSYSADQVAGLIRGIYAYHVQGNGWCDIGYNFLVDKFGRIFEGRHGGVNLAVQGAHTLAFNWDSFGVAAIGDYTSAAPSSAMLSGISSVLGWKLGLHGRNPGGRDVLVSAGGPGAKWPAGTPVAFNVVSGHRDAYATSCPGNALYAGLGSLRVGATRYLQTHAAPDQDLYGVLSSSGTKRIEVHAQSRTSSYQSRLLDVATSWSAGSAADWRFFVGPTVADTRPDLIGVHWRNTSSGRVEVQVASWASGYRDTTIQKVTPLGALDGSWDISAGGRSGGDLYFTRLRGASSGKVEVHMLTAASGYTSYGVHAATALGSLPATQVAQALVARGTGDLYLVLRSGTGSGRTEVHALTAASGYRSWSLHAATPSGQTPDRTQSQWALGTATRPDLFYLPTTGTGSGRVEVHRLSASTSYGTWTLHAATNLPATPYPAWQLTLG